MISMPSGPSMVPFVISAAETRSIIGSGVASGGGASGLDPTRPLASSNRYRTPYTQAPTGQGAGGVVAVSVYDNTSPTDEYAVQYFFPAFHNANGGAETVITNTLKVRFSIGYGPTPDPTAPSTIWTRGTIKGQADYTLTGADAPGVMSDPMFTQANPIPAGMHRFGRFVCVTSDGNVPASLGVRGSGLEGYGGSPADGAYWVNVLTNRAPLGLSSVGVYGPSQRVSRGPAERVAYGIIGDSKASGDQGVNHLSFADGVRGFIERGLNSATGVGRRFSTTIAVPGSNPGAYVRNPDGTRGENPVQFANKIASWKMLPEPIFTDIISEHCINGGFGNAIAQPYPDNMKEYFAKIKSLIPNIPIHATTAPVHVFGLNVVNGFSTQAGMPINGLFAPGGTFGSYNAALRANKLDGAVDTVIDTAILFNGGPDSAKSPDPLKPRVYEGPLVDTVAADSTTSFKVTVTDVSKWSIGDGIIIDPTGIGSAGAGGVVNGISGNELSLGSLNVAGARTGMVAMSLYYVDKLHCTKQGDDLQIPAVLAFKNARG